MPHVTKLFDKILMLRVRDAIDDKLMPTQIGFRPRRGTTQHACAFRALMDLAESSGVPLHGCFVDFSKAFDSVFWDAIPATTVVLEGPPTAHQCRVSRDDWAHATCTCWGPAHRGHPSQSRSPTRRHVSVMHIFFFILRSLTWHAVADVVHLARLTSCTSCKHDVCLFASNPEDLQALLTTFEEAALQVGLHINMGKGKTERFFRNDGMCPPRLGVLALDWEADFARHRGCCWAALLKYKHIWSSQAPRDVKRSCLELHVGAHG
eukprot:PhM_4_TR14116/c1_g3_i9/m.42872